MALGGESINRFDDLRLSYAPPQGSTALREQIARYYDVDPDWIVVTTGASEALLALYCLTAEPGASVALPFPLFATMSTMARAWGMQVTSYSLNRANRFEQTAEHVLTAVNSTTKLALVNTPHNPTGSVMTQTETERLAGALAERGISLIVDEVYHPLYFSKPIPSAAKIPNVNVVSDFSKAFSLPGLRIGWLIESNPVRREQLIDMRGYFTVSSSPLTEAIATHALAHRETLLQRLNAVAKTNLQSLAQFMKDHNDQLDWIPPSGGTVAFPWRVDGKSSRPLCEELARNGVLFAPGDCFAVPEHFRVGFGAQSTGFADALAIASHCLR
jgi:aspartate/methionine/tyrosine aminotransferase